jgi:hypothetical protein
MKMNNIFKATLIISLSIIPVLATDFNTTLGNNTKNIESLYNKKQLSGIYNKIDKSSILEMNGWRTVPFTNTDFESNLDGWTTYGNNEAVVVDSKSDVSHNSKYAYNTDKKKDYELEQYYTYTESEGMSKYTKYIKWDFEYGGYENKDYAYFRLKIYNYDGDNVYNYSSSELKGKKSQDFKKKIIKQSMDTSSIWIENVEINIEYYKDDSFWDDSYNDTDAYIDNINIKLLENKFYGTNSDENIIYPNVEKYISIYGKKGNDVIKPKNLNDYSYKAYLYGDKGNDFYILPYGNRSRVKDSSSSVDDDTVVCYQGPNIPINTTVYTYKGDDFIYAPVGGDGHRIIGGNDWDTLILKGIRSDYTFTHNDGDDIDLLTISGPDNYNLLIYEIESIGFTNSNVYDTSTYNVDINDIDLYIFKDDGTDLLKLVNKELVNIVDSKTTTDYIGVYSVTNQDINIKTDYSNNINILVNKIDKHITKAILSDGTNINTEQYHDGDNNEWSRFRVTINGNNSDNIITLKSISTDEDIFFNNIEIGRAMN